jgi:hypothetical protein
VSETAADAFFFSSFWGFFLKKILSNTNSADAEARRHVGAAAFYDPVLQQLDKHRASVAGMGSPRSTKQVNNSLLRSASMSLTANGMQVGLQLGHVGSGTQSLP